MSKVLSGQSFLDKVIEDTGNMEMAFEMALGNGLSITHELEVGTELKPFGTIKKQVVIFFWQMNKNLLLI